MKQDQALCDFQRYLFDVKRASSNTVNSYLRDVRQFEAWLLSEGKTLSAATETQVSTYIGSYLPGLGRSSATLSRCAASLRCFYAFLRSKETAVSNPAAHIRLARQKRKLPQILSSKEVELFLEQPDTRDRKGMRDKAMLELLYATGIRVSELIGLDLGDVNPELCFVRCTDGDRERLIPMYKAAARAVQDYVENVRPLLVENDREAALFVNVSGSRMSRQGFWKLVRAYQKKAGIEKEVTPQTLRNSFAVHLLEHGADVRDIQELLGHADVNSTLVYAKLVQSRLSEVYQRTHPRA